MSNGRVPPGFLGAAGRSGLAGMMGELLLPGAGATAGLSSVAMDATTAGVDKLHSVLKELTESFTNFEEKSKKAFTPLIPGGQWFESFAAIATKMQETGAELQRQTGAVEKLSAAWGGTGFGMSMAQAGEAIAGLHNNFVGFSELGKKSMKTVMKQAAGFTRLGMDIKDVGKNYELMAKAMRMSEKQMKKTQNKIAKTAISLGIAPKKLAADYNKIIPQLMHWGKASSGVFFKLAAHAKATGVEMETLLGVAAGFDEFESAAEKTGKLNMLLGGPYLNTVQMIRADEEERLNLLKESIKMTGKSVDQLGRWRVRDIAKEMGFKNLADFYKEMGAPDSVVDKFKKKLSPAQLAQINLNKAISKGVKISEVWTAWFEKMGKIIGGTFLKAMGRFGKFMMSGDGGKGIAKVFGWFADGIERLLDGWDNMDGPLKKSIKSFATFGMKMMATSVATKGFMQILSPMISLFTNPTSGLVAVMAWLITNWDGWTGTINNARTAFYSLSNTVDGFLRRMANDEQWGAIFGPLHDLWEVIQVDILGAIDNAGGGFGNWQTMWREFIGEVLDGWNTITGFFRHVAGETRAAGGGFRALINAIKQEMFLFIGEIATEIERVILRRYGAQIRQYVEAEESRREHGIFGPTQGTLGALTNDPRWRMGQQAKMVGSLGEMNATFQRQMGSRMRDMGSMGAVSEFSRMLQSGQNVQELKKSALGGFIMKSIRAGHTNYTEADAEDQDFWTSQGINEILKSMAVATAHSGGDVKSKTTTAFKQDEGLIYAPNGNAYAMAASLMNNTGQSSGDGGGGDIYLDSEKVGEFIGLGGLNKNIAFNHS